MITMLFLVTRYSIRYLVILRKWIGLPLFLLLYACAAPKNIAYFRDIADSVHRTPSASYTEPVIQTGDILRVSIYTLRSNNILPAPRDETAGWASPGRDVGNPGAGATPVTGSNGFIVDAEGCITLPLIGRIAVKDSTTEQVRHVIYSRAGEYYKDPVVNVNLGNFKVTVLGEVNRPSTYFMPGEKHSLIDALGQAGDLTIFGKRENVLLIRSTPGGEKRFVRFDLNKSDLFTSPYYYLRQGDIIYVEPAKSKIVSTDGVRTRNITIISSVLAVLIILLTRI